MNSIVLYSSGKDSTYALNWAIKNNHNVQLLTVFSELKESYMYHTTNIELTELSAKALQLPLIKVLTKGEKEKELIPLKKKLKELNCDAVISGAIRSEYQKNRVDKICNELKIKSIAPIWHKNALKYMKELIKNYEIIFTSVSCYGMEKNWLGRKLNKKTLDDLILLNKKYKINIEGEGGEYETFVLNSPIHKKKIVVEEGNVIWKRDSGILKIKKVRLEE